MNESTWMSELEKIYKVPSDALTTEEMEEKMVGVKRGMINSFIRKACRSGTMKCAGRKEGITIDGRTCQKPAYIFVKSKK